MLNIVKRVLENFIIIIQACLRSRKSQPSPNKFKLDESEERKSRLLFEGLPKIVSF